MSNKTEELVERVKKRLNILSKYSFAKEDEAMFNIVDVKELSQRLHAAEENYDIAAKMLQICENDYKERLKAAEDINRIAALDLQAKEQECERKFKAQTMKDDGKKN